MQNKISKSKLSSKIIFLLFGCFLFSTILVHAVRAESTKFIKDNATGGDCTKIGSWDAASKTCVLSTDVTETVVMYNDNITLNGNGHRITGFNTGTGVYVAGRNGIVKNIAVSKFLRGIDIARCGSVISSTVTSNYYGIYAACDNLNGSGINLSNNSVSVNSIYGIYLLNAKNSTISNNVVGPSNYAGLVTGLSDHSIFENNDFFNNQWGISLSGSYNILRQNRMHENSDSNFYIKSEDMMTNEIGTDNTVDSKPIYYEKNVSDKVYDDSMDMGAFYCINCQNVILKNVSLSSKKSPLVFWHTNNSSVEGLNSPDESSAVGLYYSNNNTIKKNTFKNIEVNYSNGNSIYNNNIMSEDLDTSIYPSFSSSFYQALPIGGNYWKRNESTCKDLNNDKICDKPFYYDGGVDNYPWTKKFDFNPPSGNSNVMFLPGIKASRLYKKGMLGIEDQLWTPNFFGNDLSDLALDENGKSINNVYTHDVLDSVMGQSIYASFIEKLKSLKTDGAINDYSSFAYDWRQNVEDVAQNGTPYPSGETKSAIFELKKLSDSSKNKKVTIVAHSNGGLLAKAMMLELEKSGEAGKVDKIVFVDSPQMGAPIDTLSMLYGYDESLLLGTLISQKDARVLIENMPGAYGLLPSKKYFERTEEPLINFSSEHTDYGKFRKAYGSEIGSFDEFRNFLLAKIDGRAKPDSGEVDKENVLRENLLDQATAMHDRLDNWVPPKDVQVIEIAGWGLDTISGVNYTEKENVMCSSILGSIIPSCSGTGKYEPIYEPRFVVDGDKIVTVPSSLMIPEGDNVKKYWVDLHHYNDKNPDVQHRNILEATNIQQFISNIVANNNSLLPEDILTARPDDYQNAKPRIRMALYSPLDIHLYDEQGRHTGSKKVTLDNGQEKIIFEEGIPNSYYYEYSNQKYVGWPEDENVRVEMDGYDSGAYAIKLEEVKITSSGEDVASHVVLTNLPTTADTTVSFSVPKTGLADMTTLEADLNGDGKIDYHLDKVINGTAILDTTPPEIKIVSPENNKNYLNNGTLKFEYSVTDNMTKPENIKTEILYDGKLLVNNLIDLSLENIGSHNFSISAEDETGNKSETKIDFSYVSDLNAIAQNVDHYTQLKLITSSDTQEFLQTKIKELAHVMEMIDKMSGKNNDNPRNNQIKLLNKKVDDLVRFIQNKFGNSILSPAKDVLIQSLNFVKM